MAILTFDVVEESDSARNGVVTIGSKSYQTPVFMPVGTRGTIKAATAKDVADIGFDVVLGNTYHLMLRPGSKVIQSIGGLHKFAGWDRLMLTDSGGFQVMSLGAKFDEGGVRFKSIYDGANVYLTPEGAVTTQEEIGADIAMVLDVCTNLPATRDQLQRAMDLTHAWAKRARSAKSREDQAQFGIVQGGSEDDLRQVSAQAIVDIGFEGYAIGGLAVGESREDMLRSIESTTPFLPNDRPRYLMGVGDPVGVVESIARGVDMFDCVAPSRLARHGGALTFQGKVHVKNKKYEEADEPIEMGCPCLACQRFPIALIRHLLLVGESTAGTLLTIHNLTFMHRLVAGARSAIREKSLDRYVTTIRSAYAR
ncbi:MAG: tRNA guanosine(34) transglycosylase Tgt [Actinomycetota bacterium]|nr:tRNA guanosine(34) transglycosylase Tgt [Actinomycetota bacterium]